MNWKFWRKKEENFSYPSINIELRPDNFIHILTNWTHPKTDADKVQLAKELATTIFLLSNGELLSTLQSSIAIAGDKLSSHEVSELTLRYLNSSLLAASHLNQPDGPVVPPTEIFAGGHQ